ncbi:hypothetical protein Peur_044185 [Populus x canadensis]
MGIKDLILAFLARIKQDSGWILQALGQPFFFQIRHHKLCPLRFLKANSIQPPL